MEDLRPAIQEAWEELKREIEEELCPYCGHDWLYEDERGDMRCGQCGGLVGIAPYEEEA